MAWGVVRTARGRNALVARSSLLFCGLLSVAIAFFGKAQASIFDTARAKLSDMAAPALLEVRAPLLAIERFVGGVGTVFSVYQENAQLRKENAELRKWQDVALSLENRVQRYEALLNAAPEPQTPSVTARVIGESNRPFVKTMILNAGTEQGVKKGQAVADDRGLIGRIFLTGQRTSWVILLTDLNSRVPVVIEPSQRRAILAGDNTPAPVLDLDLSEGAANPGDRVLSTGDGGLLPAGLPVGVIMGEGTELRVSLFASAAASDYVRILDYAVGQPPTTADAVAPAVGNSKPNAPAAGAAPALASSKPNSPAGAGPALVSSKPNPATVVAAPPREIYRPPAAPRKALPADTDTVNAPSAVEEDR